MALICPFTRFGAAFPNAYHYVERIQANNKGSVDVTVLVFSNEAARQVGAEILFGTVHTFPHNIDVSGTPLEVAYALLKAMPDYAEAVDA